MAGIHQASALLVAQISAPLARKAGRPKAQREVGPTPQTQAKLEPDLLDLLTRRKIIDKDQAAAGREILDAWEVVTPANLRGTYGMGSASAPDSERAKWLTQVWNRWANGCFACCHVRHFVIVEWLLPATSEMQRRCDIDGGGQVMAKALTLWQQASRGIGQDRSAAQQAALRDRAGAQLLDIPAAVAAL